MGWLCVDQIRNNDGIGDLPYEVNAAYSSFDGAKRDDAIVPCGQDNYPLMHPIEIKDVALEVPNSTPTSSPSLDSYLKPLSSQTTMAIIVTIIIAVIVILSVLLYLRHQKPLSRNSDLAMSRSLYKNTFN